MIEQISFAKTYGVAHVDSLLQVIFILGQSFWEPLLFNSSHLNHYVSQEMLLGGVAAGVYQPQHESSAASSSVTTTSSNTTATVACAVQVIMER